MKIVGLELLHTIALDILRYIPSKPFLCLPMSAMLYAVLKDEYNFETQLVTGNLSYKSQFIFKQDFSIPSSQDDTFFEWGGHAWVQIEDSICDLSFFRTLYSDKFTKPCKPELIQTFGQGRGFFIASRNQLHEMGFSYETIDYLSDDIASGIIKGFEKLPILYEK